MRIPWDYPVGAFADVALTIWGRISAYFVLLVVAFTIGQLLRGEFIIPVVPLLLLLGSPLLCLESIWMIPIPLVSGASFIVLLVTDSARTVWICLGVNSIMWFGLGLWFNWFW